VHKWRSEEDAVLVGYRTALIDNPRLDVREFPGRNPARVVVDRDGSLPIHLNLLKEDGARVIVLTQSERAVERAPLPHVTYIRCGADRFHARAWLKALYTLGIGSVLVEGGAALMTRWPTAVLDETRVFTAPILWERGSRAPHQALPVRSISKVGVDHLEQRFR
jgi:diaminohydroxyphosphoribosylaminopyrimidine deaminase/5-amino-6-(5-phosphoribosylamino)uracil reductase